MRKTGYRPPQKEDADWQISRLFGAAGIRADAEELPEFHTLEEYIPDVLDQGALGSCVFNGITQQYRILQKARYPMLEPALGSRLFAYRNCRFLDDPLTISSDVGADPKTAVKAINKWGLPAEEHWPYDVSKFAQCPPMDAYRYAFDNRLPLKYYWINSDEYAIDNVKTAICHGYPVGIGTGIDSSYGTWKPTEPPLKPPANPTGLHYMVLVGYLPDGVLCLGSWGTDIADEGIWLFDWSYLSYYYTSAMLVIEDSADIRL